MRARVGKGEISLGSRYSTVLGELVGAATYSGAVQTRTLPPLAPCGSRRLGQVNEIGQNVNRFPLLGVEHIRFAVVIILQV